MTNNNSSCVESQEIDNKALSTLPATLVSSSLSIVGSALIIISFALWSAVRKSTARKILLFLAIADFFTAVSFLSAVIVHYVFIHIYKSKQGFRNNEHNYILFCRGQAFVTVYFQCVSFFWTSYLAIYFTVLLVFNKPKLGMKLIQPFVFTAWGVPLIICGYLLASKRFGIGDSRSSVGWCFIDNSFLQRDLGNSKSNYQSDVRLYFMLELVSLKLWEILTFLVIIVCYLLIVCFNRCKFRKEYKLIVQNNSNNEDTLILEDDPGHWNTAHMFNSKANNRSPTAIKSKKTMVEALSKADLKLLLVPFIFFLFRFWGTLRFFISMMPSCNIYVPETERKPDMAFFCIHTSCYRVLYNEMLLLLNAFGDPAQGFGNAILFVFLSKAILMRFFGPLIRCFNRICCKNVNRDDEETQTAHSHCQQATQFDDDKASKIIITYNSKSRVQNVSEGVSQSTSSLLKHSSVKKYKSINE